jgi:hypothetical protein
MTQPLEKALHLHFLPAVGMAVEQPALSVDMLAQP